MKLKPRFGAIQPGYASGLFYSSQAGLAGLCKVSILTLGGRYIPTLLCGGNLTHSTAVVPNSCCLKGSAPYWSNPPFLVFVNITLTGSVVKQLMPHRSRQMHCELAYYWKSFLHDFISWNCDNAVHWDDIDLLHHLYNKPLHYYTLCIFITTHSVTQWHYWQGNGHAIHRSRVWVLAGHHCVVALGKLLTPVCLCHQSV